MISDEELHERYGTLPILEQVERMINDMVDTDIIMDRVRKYGQERYNHGVRDQHSRSLNSPGNGDMGG